MDKSEKTIIFTIIAIVAGCLLFSGLCAAIFIIAEKLPTTTLFDEVPTPAMPTIPVCTVALQDSRQPVDIDQSMFQISLQSQNELQNTTMPIADLNKIEERLTGKSNIPTQLFTTPVQYQIGDQLNFYKMDEDNNNILISATLRYANDIVYFWVEEGLDRNQDDINNLLETFSNQIYPTNRAFFGSEWNPGVDNDPHLYILFAGGLGGSLAGYAPSSDYVLPEVNNYSNAHEMFVITADNNQNDINDPYMLGTMAHEHQHVILGFRDPDEELWLNEGFSELATLINGYEAGGFDYYFTQNPDFQLTNWSSDGDLNDLNYGASYLFTTYFYGRFGERITRDLVASPLNGLASLDGVFQSNQIIDPSTGNILTADSFFQDWTITNFINNQSIEDGRYFYSQYLDVPMVDQTEWLNTCDGSIISGSVYQFGTDYIQIACNNPVKLQFSGDPTNRVITDQGENQSNFMWSNRGDAVDSSLTREFDLTSYSGEIKLSFDVWYDLEEDFDYAYVLASRDNKNWHILETESCVTQDIVGINYGCGFNGTSGNWVVQNANLSQYAGSKIWLRFEMISDGALANEGFAVDNINIPTLGYEENFDEGDGGWVKNGFSRIHNVIPQTFLVSIITSGNGITIKKYTVLPGEALELDIDPNCLGEDPVLVVSGSSRFTRQEVQYTITLTE